MEDAIEAAKKQVAEERCGIKYAYSLSEKGDESMYGDLLDLQAQAIAVGRKKFGNAAFFVLELREVDGFQFVPSAADIVEDMAQNAADNDGPEEDWPDYSEAMEADLDAVLAAWFKRWRHKLYTNWYHVANTERVPALDAKKIHIKEPTK